MALVFILCMVALVACGGDEGEPDTDTPPTQQTERIKFSNTDGVEGATKNPNAGKNWDEFKELTDWEEKWNNDDLYYVPEYEHLSVYELLRRRAYTCAVCRREFLRLLD